MKRAAAILIIILLASAGSFTLYGSSDLSSLRGLSLTNAKIPIYNRGGKPQMMIFVNKAERHGRVLSGTETVLEFIRPSASVDDIADAWRVRAYPLKAPFRQVFNFWLPRNKYSEAVVITSKADIDPETHRASGSAPVFFRSPLIDLNGLGFEANFDRREIRINSEIEVVLRTGNSDPRKLRSAGNKNYEYLTASGDSLLIELDNKRILLIGSVVIKEKQASITCDRLTIEMSGKPELKNTAGGKKKQLISSESELDGLSRLLADGNIVISGSAGASGKLYADHMVYDLKSSRITLTSDSSGKIASRQEILDNAAKLAQTDPADIEGYVVLDDRQIRSYGRSVVISLKNKRDSHFSDGFVSGNMSMTGSKKASGSLNTILYPEGIILTGKPGPDRSDPPFLLHANHGEYLPGHNVINLKDDITARDSGTRLACSRAVLKLKNTADADKNAADLDLSSIHCRENVRLHHTGEGTQSGTLLADKADFFPHENRIIFYENVRGSHDKSTLNCNQLELLLSDEKSSGRKEKTQNQSALASTSKILKEIKATGNVRMTDPHAKLTTGELTMFFRPLAPGEKPVSGMLQAGGARLVRIDCGSGVKVVSSDADSKKLFGSAESKGVKTLTAMSSSTDLLSNRTTLTGNVHIFDDLSMLKCSTMNLFGRKTVPAAAAGKKAAAAAADIDADPYAMIDTENFAPSRIALTGDLELERVECIKNVIISRKVQNNELRAGGDRADYAVDSQKIIMTGKAPNRPWVEMDNRRQESDRLIYHLPEERFESSGNTQTILRNFPKGNGGKK